MGNAAKKNLFVDEMPRGGWPRGHMFLTWFGLGMINRAPGTLASFGCIPLGAAFVYATGPAALAVGAAVAFALGWIFTAMHLRRVPEDEDPQWIVIDEVAGQWLTLAVVPLDLVWYALGFGLFRFFDIVKPWPVSWADRRPGTFGIMFDDILAGAYAAAILWSIRYVWLNGLPFAL